MLFGYIFISTSITAETNNYNVCYRQTCFSDCMHLTAVHIRQLGLAVRKVQTDNSGSSEVYSNLSMFLLLLYEVPSTGGTAATSQTACTA